MILIDTFQVNPHALRWTARDELSPTIIIGVKYTRGEGQPRRWAYVTTYDYFQRASQLLKPPGRGGAMESEEDRNYRQCVRSSVAEVARFDDQWTNVNSFRCNWKFGGIIRSTEAWTNSKNIFDERLRSLMLDRGVALDRRNFEETHGLKTMVWLIACVIRVD